jgi:hypothetical protein
LGAPACPHCGQPFIATAGAGAAAAPAIGTFSPTSQRTWPWVVGPALAAILALFGLRATGLLRIGGESPDSHLQASAAGPNSNLQAHGSDSIPLLPAQAQAPAPFLQVPAKLPPPILEDTKKDVSMPDDIYRWLKWLEEIEKEKRALTKKEDTEMSTLIATLNGAEGLSAADVTELSDPDSTMKNAPAVGDLQNLTDEMIKDWAALKTRFDSYPPPKECVPIGDAFDHGLEGLADYPKQIQALVNGVTDKETPTRADADPAIGDIKDLGGKHKKDIDSEFTGTDELIENICEKYNTRKWFTIEAHGGSAGLLSLPGN